MGKLIYQSEIQYRLRHKPWLEPVFTSLHQIPERIKQYDGNLFVVRNRKNHRYEIHSLANIGDSFGFALPLQELDARAFYMVQKSDIRVRGTDIFKEMDEHNAKLEREQENRRSDELRELAERIKTPMSRMAWEGV